LLGVLSTAGAASLLWWLIGAPHLTGPHSLASADRFDLVKIALTVTGGIGGVVFLVIAYRKQHLGEAAERREDTKLFNERFGKASEQLGNDSAAVRLAGVYAMAGLADDWADQRQTCIDVLCAYLCMHYNPTPPDEPSGRQAWHGERQVRHTVIRVITAHLRESAITSWQCHNFDFTGAVFDGGDFSHAVFSGGKVDFGYTTFSGGTIDFSNATFSGGDVYFLGATFSGGTVDFHAATFSGGTVYFLGATFSGGTVNFGHATFSGGTVDFLAATFSGGTVNFSRRFGSNFGRATFSGGTVDLSKPRSWDRPPQFDGWQGGGPPAGLLLPATPVPEAPPNPAAT
jgi:hypothetical protein